MSRKALSLSRSPLQPCLAGHRQGLDREQGLELRAGSLPVRRRVRRDARAPIAASGFQTAGRFSKSGPESSR